MVDLADSSMSWHSCLWLALSEGSIPDHRAKPGLYYSCVSPRLQCELRSAHLAGFQKHDRSKSGRAKERHFAAGYFRRSAYDRIHQQSGRQRRARRDSETCVVTGKLGRWVERRRHEGAG